MAWRNVRCVLGLKHKTEETEGQIEGTEGMGKVSNQIGCGGSTQTLIYGDGLISKQRSFTSVKLKLQNQLKSVLSFFYFLT